MPEDFGMLNSRRVRVSQGGIAAGEPQGDVEPDLPGLVHSKPLVDSAVSAASRHQHAGTRRLRQPSNTDHHRRNRSPGRTTAGGWMIRDSQGRRHHSKHGRVLFAQARQTLLQGTSETPPEPPPPGSTHSCYICRGVDIRWTCDPPAGGGTENDIPTAERSSTLQTASRNDA
jgi:hypothetical protein